MKNNTAATSKGVDFSLHNYYIILVRSYIIHTFESKSLGVQLDRIWGKVDNTISRPDLNPVRKNGEISKFVKTARYFIG